MAELSTQTFAQCREQVDYTTKIDNYMVTLNRRNPGKYQANWHCTCVGFQYSPATNRGCKHIDRAKMDQCQFDQFVTGEKPTKGGKCPHCRGAIVYQNVAV